MDMLREPDTPAQTRQRLLRSAENLVVREGVHALSVRRIANAAQVNSALIRYHFGGTQGLLRDLALRNAARINDARAALLAQIAASALPDKDLADTDLADYELAVDALIVPLWASAAMSPDYRAIVVLDEIFARADPGLHQEIWTLFADGVQQVTAALARVLPHLDPPTLTWRVRFVTAAALDIPPRSPRAGEDADRPDAEMRFTQFRRFARHALRAEM